jgi:hypothetical protein
MMWHGRPARGVLTQLFVNRIGNLIRHVVENHTRPTRRETELQRLASGGSTPLLDEQS